MCRGFAEGAAGQKGAPQPGFVLWQPMTLRKAFAVAGGSGDKEDSAEAPRGSAASGHLSCPHGRCSGWWQVPREAEISRGGCLFASIHPSEAKPEGTALSPWGAQLGVPSRGAGASCGNQTPKPPKPPAVASGPLRPGRLRSPQSRAAARGRAGCTGAANPPQVRAGAGGGSARGPSPGRRGAAAAGRRRRGRRREPAAKYSGASWAAGSARALPSLPPAAVNEEAAAAAELRTRRGQRQRGGAGRVGAGGAAAGPWRGAEGAPPGSRPRRGMGRGSGSRGVVR